MPFEDRSRRTTDRKVYWAALLYLLVVALIAALAFYDASQSTLADLESGSPKGLSTDQPWHQTLNTLGIMLISLIASLPFFLTMSQRLRDSNADLQLELTELYRDMDRQPSLDELTSQYNRAGFLHLIDRELLRCRRHGLDCCVAMLEIDGFAALRTARGRAAADAVLMQCAARLAGAIRGCDLLGRIDDHRFGLMLPHTQLEKGVIAAERVRNVLAQTPMGMPDVDADVQITVSVGITSVQESDTDRETLIRVAQQRLDRAAGAGRDLVVAADA